MNRKKNRTLGFMGIILLLIGGFALISFYMIFSQKIYLKYNEGIQPVNNPDRGYYVQIDTKKYQKIASLTDDVRLALLAYDIESFAESELSQEKLMELENALKFAKEHHVSVIFRAAYGFHEDVREPESLVFMETHMSQISEVLNKYADNILVIQAGMLGEYGEWHSSRYLEGDKAAQKKNRIFILKSWERYLDDTIKVAVRRPRFIREAIEEEVLKGRLGIHNDALLSTESDMGTYDDSGMDRFLELEWMQESLNKQINGGEMPVLGERNEPENAHKEFGMLHLSYLNLRYNEEIINKWMTMEVRGTNAKEYIGSHLGYRFYIAEIEVQKELSERQIRRNRGKFTITLKNTGYAPLPSKYKMYMTVNSGDREYIQEIECDDIYNISNGETAKVQVPIQFPESLWKNREKFTVGVKFAQDKLEQEEKNCIQLANNVIPYQNGSNSILVFNKKKKAVMPTFRAEILIK